MRKLVLVAGLAAAAFIPSFAFAQSSCEQQRDNRVVGTVAGAGIGALVGSAIAPRHDRGAGAIIGAIGGGVIGNQVTRPDADCAHAYGYYDRDSQWHANATPTVMARGYYDRDGAWVDGAPNGYYDHSGRWMASNASGYYDQGGRWVAGSASGAYDVNGHWMPGAVNGHRDGSGVWVADAQPGYYDTQRHWRAGPVQGHYDDGGVWIPASTGPMYGGGGMNHHDVRAREAWMEQRIRTAASNGDLSHHDARRALSKLSSIRQQDANMRDGSDRLSPQEDAMLQARLDRLKTSLGLRQDDQSTF
jgi:hypothetical protein